MGISALGTSWSCFTHEVQVGSPTPAHEIASGRNLRTGDSSEADITTKSDAFKTARSMGVYALVDFGIGRYTHSTLDTNSLP